jgi:DNA-directed RNA polymerase specialized sigma subunit
MNKKRIITASNNVNQPYCQETSYADHEYLKKNNDPNRESITRMLYLYPQINNRIYSLKEDLVEMQKGLTDHEVQLKEFDNVAGDDIKISKKNIMQYMLEALEYSVDLKKKHINDLELKKQKISKALDRLLEYERNIVELRYFQRMTWQQISQETNIKIKYLYQHSSLIKAKLRHYCKFF